MPYEQHLRATGTSLRVLVRTQGPPEALENLVRTTVHARSTSVPMRFSTLEQSLAEYSAAPRFRAILVSGFGLIALCLAVAGIYGVLTCLVGQRTREIGLRMALGATKGMILRMVIREGAVLAAAGMVLGVLPGEFHASKALRIGWPGVRDGFSQLMSFPFDWVGWTAHTLRY